MKKRRGCVKWAVVAVLSLVALALLVLCPLAFLYARQVEQARVEYEPPTVYIREPASGLSAPTGTYILVAATAVGRTPITRVELWAADEVVEIVESDVPEGRSSFAATFEFTVSEGPNLLFARAVNAAGIIGQSPPVAVLGAPLRPGDIVTEVTVEEGQTLEDIAASYEVDPGTLQQLNPNLGGQQPSPGSTITVPSPEVEEDDEHVAPPSVGPSVPTAPPGGSPVPMPAVPPLGALPTLPGPFAPGPFLPSPGIVHTDTVPTAPLPVIVGSLVPLLATPVFSPPAAPTGLQGYVEDCMVNLRWTDNAWDELRYDLWMAGLSGTPRLIAPLQPASGGPAWVQFPALQTGPLSFWVEAVNAIGKQPSNIVWLEIDSKCPTAAPERLQVVVQDITVHEEYDRAYCYVSFENTPEVRTPGDDSEFVQVQGGRGTLGAGRAAGRSFVLPIPEDGSLDVAGECWAWSGDDLSRMGDFGGGYTRDTWDGTRRPLSGEAYEIGLTIQTSGDSDTPVTYDWEDPSIQPPIIVKDELVGTEPQKDLYLDQWEQWFVNRRLRWQWTGSKQLTGFTIYMDGKPYKTVYGGDVRETMVTLPALCDRGVMFQMTADVDDAHSPLSQVYLIVVPKCQAYFQVKVDRIQWWQTCDGSMCGGCSTCEAQGVLRLEMGVRASAKRCPNQPYKVKCKNWYTFAQMCAAKPGETGDVVILPFDKEAKPLRFDIMVHILDNDGIWSATDEMAFYRHRIVFPDFETAQAALGCGEHYDEFGGSGTNFPYRILYTLTVFPSSCAERPTYSPKDWGVVD
jgi:LysM repeat protein